MEVRVTPFGSVSVKATPVKSVPVLGLVIVNVRVDVPPATIRVGKKDLLMAGGALTVTIFVPVLLVSLISSIFEFGSTIAVFTRLPDAVGITVKATLKEPFTGKVTTPLAVQLKTGPVIEQLIVPVGGVAPLVTVNPPCG